MSEAANAFPFPARRERVGVRGQELVRNLDGAGASIALISAGDDASKLLSPALSPQAGRGGASRV
jgi:hypothetical protein